MFAARAVREETWNERDKVSDSSRLQHANTDCYLLAQSLHLGVLLYLQISVLLFERLYDSLEILVFPLSLQNILVGSSQGLGITPCLRSNDEIKSC